MSGSHPVCWIVILLLGALSALGCTADPGSPQGETGSLSVDLVIADGIVINQAGWQITGNGMDMSDTIDVSAPGSTASVEVFGLPPGDEDYTVTLTAESADEQVTCKGSADFNVEIGETTDVMVVLNCKLPRRLGAVRVNGEFNICAELIKAVISPLRTSVGNDIDVSAQAVDQEGDPIAFSWTGTGGSFADASAAATTYTCEEVGDQEITISVTDNDEYCDMATWTVPVTCVAGDGGTGGTGGAGGEAGAGGQGGEAGAGGAGGEAGAGGAGGEAGAGGAGGEAGAGGQGGMGGSVDPCEGKDCSDGNECTANLCADGVCSNPPVMNDTMCADNTGTCQSGVCVPSDLCLGKDCSDGNECTADLCADGVCSNPPVQNGNECNDGAGACVGGTCVGNECSVDADCPDDDGNECTDPVCDQAAAPTTCSESAEGANGDPCDGGAGVCNGGVCEAVSEPVIGTGSGSTSWNAQPKMATGCTYVPATTTCTGCTVSATPVVGGGQCSQFGAQVVRGCEVPGGVLNAQLALDVFVTVDASSTGDGNLDHDVAVSATNPALSTAAALVTVDGADIYSDVTSAVPSQVVNSLDPAVAGQLLGFFTGGGNTLVLDSEILPASTPMVPTSSPTVSVNFSGDFLISLTIQSSGTALDVDSSNCTFDNPAPNTGAPFTLPVDPT